jgi:hypothetical protein
MLHLDREGSSGEDEDRWWELVGVDAAPPPPLDRLRSSILAVAATADRVDVTAIALDVLLNDMALFEWGHPIRAALAQASD